MDPNTNFSMPPWLVRGLGGLLIIFVGLLVVQKASEVSKNLSSGKPANTISISAEGKVNAVPDMATVNLGVFSQGSDAAKLQDQNSEQANRVVDFVKQQGIADEGIVTSQFSIYPQYDYSNGRSRVTGYQANQTVTVKIKDVSNLGETVGKILDGATDNGANEITGVYFGIEDPDDLRQEARKQAIAKAKDKAQELADEAGIKLGKVVSISESGANYPQPVYYDRGIAETGIGGAGGGTPDIQVGSQEITETITVIFEVK